MSLNEQFYRDAYLLEDAVVAVDSFGSLESRTLDVQVLREYSRAGVCVFVCRFSHHERFPEVGG